MKLDEEIRNDFKLFVDKSDTINLTCFNMEKEQEDNGRMIELIMEDFLKIFSENPQGVYCVLVNLLPIGKINRYGFSSKTRKIGVQLASHKQIGKSAVVTSSAFVKVVIEFIITMVGKKDYIKVFLTEEEALKWLKEE